jgi:hypothetical protein
MTKPDNAALIIKKLEPVKDLQEELATIRTKPGTV